MGTFLIRIGIQRSQQGAGTLNLVVPYITLVFHHLTGKGDDDVLPDGTFCLYISHFAVFADFLLSEAQVKGLICGDHFVRAVLI